MLSNGEDVVTELPIEHLVMYENYYRVGRLIKLGAKCVCCLKGVEHFLALRLSSKTSKGVRFALYTEDYVELTIDHIKPRHLGGKDTMNNYQVLCLFCNQAKGSADMTIEQLRIKISNIVRNFKDRKKEHDGEE